MSRNHHSQRRTDDIRNPIGNGSRPVLNHKWEQMVLELQECCDEPVQTLDEIAAARYLSSDCSDEEREEIKQMTHQPVDFNECIILAETVLKDTDSVA